ncbi:MAG: tRNA uridine-5-carboxymethylaminomethyl(34) synthesis GTPase MnmE [Erysipelotrichaceae bacterium]|jgi:tRNA modification GTPase|nr:tRNA uridine-5-carboxymethylaminomethyl(34) synthesis GTPase MnmE [Bacillota bacterium]MDY0118105.1 tRNA uridine-5-carboxymethylaminomethyl(34) synthesis GTPase MnmE [Bacilli bacterium]NLJ32906.1 tRNA uridine-5-carboxymethylaminomethyl(34) synthesis GTPase MnmE [Erysipelotrichaceae bacterium]
MLDTIVAVATAPIKSALAIIRVSGSDAFSLVSKIFTSDLTKVTKRTSFFGKIRTNGKNIDEVVLLAYKGPQSFTGEDVVEIITHGSPLITNEIIEILLGLGARIALNGEFSARAYANNKIDLIQAEAINDMINATTKEAKNLALLSLSGEASAIIQPIKEKIADILSLIEVNIDYPEYEDIEQANKEMIISAIDKINLDIAKLINEGNQGKIIKEGINVAIVGKPNVGKSSLLNAFLQEEKAIVTDIAGTTRDIVEGSVNVKGITLHLFDTAGIRESQDRVEKIGIHKAKKTIEDADLVLLVLDASGKLTKEDEDLLEMTKDKKRLIVHNKADLKLDDKKDAIYVSAIQKDVSVLEEKIISLFGIEEKSYFRPSLNNARQLGLLEKVREYLKLAKRDAEEDLPVDLISVNLHGAYNAILEILGEHNDNDLTDEIFSRFCVGK